jgi:hypothetical protein
VTELPTISEVRAAFATLAREMANEHAGRPHDRPACYRAALTIARASDRTLAKVVLDFEGAAAVATLCKSDPLFIERCAAALILHEGDVGGRA